MTDKKETKNKQIPATVPQNPESTAPESEKNGFKAAGLPEPTRYNDWEVNGRCSDF